MSNFDLLDAVHGPDGYVAVVGIKEGEGTEQYLLSTREQVNAKVAELVGRQKNVFFGVAKYATPENRKKDNVLSVKSVWLDIDCGEDKATPNPSTGLPAGYADQEEAMRNLIAFVRLVGLPKPTVVDSGRGLHVYWPFTETVSRHEWEPIASRLKEICKTHELWVDGAVFEAARILRVPGTFNFKGEQPVQVRVLLEGEPTPVQEIRDTLGVRESVLEPSAARPMSEMAKAIQGSLTSNFAKILNRADGGCAQLKQCYEERATLAEPRWFSALSIAKFCNDRETAVRMLSEDHPGYDPAKTEEKLRHIAGPHSCAVFESQNPGGCAKCPFKGKIKSPISLGKELLASEPDAEIEVDIEVADGSVVTNKYVIPEYPFPYARGKNGGVWRKPEDEEAEPVLIYRNDLYVVKRMWDPENGYCTIFRLHMRKDGVHEFAIPNTKIMDQGELKKALAFWGVTANSPKAFNALVQYLITSIQHFEDNRKAEMMRSQFGWADNDSKFIVGYKEISADGVYHQHPSKSVEHFADAMGPTGSFDKWKEIINLYNTKGLEPHAFAVATALGAPLFKLSGQKGAILSLIHPDSGTGKTTILHACNSFWGSPDGLCATQDDTYNSKVLKIGVHNSLPICFDEMTNTKPELLSALAYMITHGKGKDRMKGSTNELRTNNTTWTTIALCSSNKSFYQSLEELKGRPDGEIARILEYKIEQVNALDPEHAKEMFDIHLLRNYGHAGEIYARYLVQNLEEVKALYSSVQKSIDRTLKLKQKERFWSALVAANLTGILIGNRLGIIDWDLPRITAWALKALNKIRGEVAPPVDTDLGVLGDFINNNMNHMLIVEDCVDRRSNLRQAPLLEPRNELRIRFEPDTRMVFISARAFKSYCSARSMNSKSISDQLTKRGLLLKTENKRMAKGMRLSTPAVPALWLDGNHPDFADLAESLGKDAVAQAQETADGGVGD